MDKLFSFPNPVNDYAARAVAAIVIVLVILFEITANEFLLLFYNVRIFSKGINRAYFKSNRSSGDENNCPGTWVSEQISSRAP